MQSQEKADPKAEAAAEEDGEDGVVEGLSVRLLPHQVEGVAWMIDKNVGRLLLLHTHGGLPPALALANVYLTEGLIQDTSAQDVVSEHWSYSQRSTFDLGYLPGELMIAWRLFAFLFDLCR